MGFIKKIEDWQEKHALIKPSQKKKKLTPLQKFIGIKDERHLQQVQQTFSGIFLIVFGLVLLFAVIPAFFFVSLFTQFISPQTFSEIMWIMVYVGIGLIILGIIITIVAKFKK